MERSPFFPTRRPATPPLALARFKTTPLAALWETSKESMWVRTSLLAGRPLRATPWPAPTPQWVIRRFTALQPDPSALRSSVFAQLLGFKLLPMLPVLLLATAELVIKPL